MKIPFNQRLLLEKIISDLVRTLMDLEDVPALKEEITDLFVVINRISKRLDPSCYDYLHNGTCAYCRLPIEIPANDFPYCCKACHTNMGLSKELSE